MKLCGGCKKRLDFSMFNKCSSMSDGLQVQCKSCRAEYQRKYRKTKAGKKRDKKWNSSEGAKKAYIRYKNANPKIKAAHQAIKNEIRSGRMKKQPCSECNNSHAVSHHDDYAYPLVVRWLCPGCHNKWHKENGEGLNSF